MRHKDIIYFRTPTGEVIKSGYVARITSTVSGVATDTVIVKDATRGATFLATDGQAQVTMPPTRIASR